jgi:hypothetical protein
LRSSTILNMWTWFSRMDATMQSYPASILRAFKT